MKLSDAFSRPLFCYYYRNGSLIAETALSIKPFANRSVSPADIKEQIMDKTTILLNESKPFKCLSRMTKGYEKRTFADIKNGTSQETVYHILYVLTIHVYHI